MTEIITKSGSGKPISHMRERQQRMAFDVLERKSVAVDIFLSKRRCPSLHILFSCIDRSCNCLLIPVFLLENNVFFEGLGSLLCYGTERHTLTFTGKSQYCRLVSIFKSYLRSGFFVSKLARCIFCQCDCTFNKIRQYGRSVEFCQGCC